LLDPNQKPDTLLSKKVLLKLAIINRNTLVYLLITITIIINFNGENLTNFNSIL
jgi:hypothetical protein